MLKKLITVAALMLAASGARAADELAPMLCKLAELPPSCTLNPAHFDHWTAIVDYVIKTHNVYSIKGRPDDRTLQEYDAARVASVEIRAEQLAISEHLSLCGFVASGGKTGPM